MGFDVKAALARALETENQECCPCLTANPAKTAKQPDPDHQSLASLASLATHPAPDMARATPPDVEIFEERAAIAEYDGGLSRADAERLAARSQGYDNVVAFREAGLVQQDGLDTAHPSGSNLTFRTARFFHDGSTCRNI